MSVMGPRRFIVKMNPSKGFRRYSDAGSILWPLMVESPFGLWGIALQALFAMEFRYGLDNFMKILAK